MTKRDTVYIEIYRHCYGEIPEGFDVHHLDGNRANNHPANLYACSKQEHYDIHYSQGDYGACFKLAERMKVSPKELSELVRAQNRKKVEEGTHHWLGGRYQRKTQQRLVKEGTHNWLGKTKEARERELKKVENGTHTFLNLNRYMNVEEHTCPVCGTTGKGRGAMYRWHFSNCKEKRDGTEV